jgi:hypoxanthine phosphoribosyltransferase
MAIVEKALRRGKEFEGIEYFSLHWEEYYLLLQELMLHIYEYCETHGNFDAIVFAMRGGEYVAEVATEALEIPTFPMKVHTYRRVMPGQDALQEETVLEEPFTPLIDLTGKRVLVLDDLNHTTKTLNFIRSYLEEKGIQVTTAVVLEKPGLIAREADISPVLFTNAWVIQPWESDGGFRHPLGEFVLQRFPDWMDREENPLTWNQCCDLLRMFGVTEDILAEYHQPNFQSKFRKALLEYHEHQFPGEEVPHYVWDNLNR